MIAGNQGFVLKLVFFRVVPGGIEPPSQAPETYILSVVLRDHDVNQNDWDVPTFSDQHCRKLNSSGYGGRKDRICFGEMKAVKHSLCKFLLDRRAIRSSCRALLVLLPYGRSGCPDQEMTNVSELTLAPNPYFCGSKHLIACTKSSSFSL